MPAARRLSWWKRLLALLAATYLAWCLIVYSAQDSLLFPGPRGAFKPPDNAQRLTHPIDSGDVFAYLSFPSAQSATPRPLVVLFHGNGESIARLEGLRRGYLSRGYAVLTPEFRGYAGSAGSPSEPALVDDALAFIEDVIKRPDIDASHLLYHGRSLGGAIAAQVSTHRPPTALILQSTFTSIADMSWSFGVPPLVVKNPFHTDHILATLPTPVLLIHGTGDTIIPISHSRKLATIGQGRTLVELPGNHNDFPIDPVPYWAAIDTWLQAHALPISTDPPR
ncbi:MAG: alpha/beta hydrolase [Planctomycetota bacterium]